MLPATMQAVPSRPDRDVLMCAIDFRSRIITRKYHNYNLSLIIDHWSSLIVDQDDSTWSDMMMMVTTMMMTMMMTMTMTTLAGASWLRHWGLRWSMQQRLGQVLQGTSCKSIHWTWHVTRRCKETKVVSFVGFFEDEGFFVGLCRMWEEMESDRPFTFQNYFRGVLSTLGGCRPLARAKACIHLFKSHLLLLGSAWCFCLRRYRVFLFLGGTAYCLQGHVGVMRWWCWTVPSGACSN